MLKIIARPKPYSTYIPLFTKDTVVETDEENWEIALDKIERNGNYWLIEVLKPTPNGKMVSIHTELNPKPIK